MLPSNPRWPASILPPSPGDKLLQHAYGAKIELIRYEDAGEPQTSISFEVSGSITDGPEAKRLLAALLESFNGPRAELEGGAV